MKENILRTKSFDFALLVIKEYRNLSENKREFILSEQLLKSGTSVGANVEEACGAQSKKDFLNKISVSYKEARETHYWLKLLLAGGYIEKPGATLLINKIQELERIMAATILTTKNNLQY